MIQYIYSSLSSFKSLELKPGLNVLIAKKEAGASDKQTRNRAGKTSLIEIVHFLTGSEAGKDSLFRSEALVNASFGMEFDLGGRRESPYCVPADPNVPVRPVPAPNRPDPPADCRCESGGWAEVCWY